MSAISDFFNNLSTTGLSNLTSAASSLGSSGLGALVGGLSGPSNNALSIGKLLGKVDAYYATGNTMGLMIVETGVAPLEVGLSSAQVSALNNVWAQVGIPNNAAMVAAAVESAKGALGLTQ
jgi:hypothetical protein